MRGLITIIVGVIFLIGGLTGKLVIIGTQSTTGAAVLGGALIAFGIYRVATSNS